MSAKAKIKSLQWSCRGRAHFTCKRRARRGQKSLLLRHGRYAAQRLERWHGPPVLHHLRSREVVSRDFVRLRRRSPSERQGFRKRQTVRKEFGNAMDSRLTAGGAYMTGEVKHVFQRLLPRLEQGRGVDPLVRAVCRRRRHRKRQTARHRRASGRFVAGSMSPEKSAQPVREPRWVRSIWKPRGLRRRPQQRLHQLVAIGRQQIIPMLKDDPTTLYIYPDAADIDAVAQAVKAGRSLPRAGLYWNASCLREIGSPKFWPKETLEPILVQYKKDHPAPPPQPTPICKGR